MFLYRGWAERFNIMLANSLGADLAALFFSIDGLDPKSMGFIGKMIPFGTNETRLWKGFRQIYLKYRVLFHTRFLSDYDTVIFSNDSLSAIRNARKDARKIYYAHSLPRYLFEEREFYYQKVPFFLRPIYVLIRAIFEIMYRHELGQVDQIYTNSTNLQMAIKTYLGRESEIIHPPVDTKAFIPTPHPNLTITKTPHPNPLLEGEGVMGENYYISFSKLSSLKRVARTVEAFRDMPDTKLLVIYGKNDPQKDEIIKIAEWCPNITFLTLSNNNDLPQYISAALATIFIAQNEDFGMVALESMACGVPVIGVDEWGIKETVIHQKTGFLISKEATKIELIEAVRHLDRETALTMKDDCIKRAHEFSLENFETIVKEKFL